MAMSSCFHAAIICIPPKTRTHHPDSRPTVSLRLPRKVEETEAGKPWHGNTCCSMDHGWHPAKPAKNPSDTSGCCFIMLSDLGVRSFRTPETVTIVTPVTRCVCEAFLPRRKRHRRLRFIWILTRKMATLRTALGRPAPHRLDGRLGG